MDDPYTDNLTKEEYEALREGKTETRFSGKYVNPGADGTYRCKGCGTALFSSKDQVDSRSGDPGLAGWPSFTDAAAENIGMRQDTSHGMVRTEVFCKNCGGHLGHLFDDVISGAKSKHYCINSVCLDFEHS